MWYPFNIVWFCKINDIAQVFLLFEIIKYQTIVNTIYECFFAVVIIIQLIPFSNQFGEAYSFDAQ